MYEPNEEWEEFWIGLPGVARTNMGGVNATRVSGTINLKEYRVQGDNTLNPGVLCDGNAFIFGQ